VVVVECAGDVLTDATRLLQPAFASDTLRVFDGQLHGAGLKFGAGKTRDAYVTGWTDPTQFVAWPVRLNEPVTYQVIVTYDAEAKAAGGEFAVAFGPAAAAKQARVHAGTMQSAELGRVRLTPGEFELKLFAVSLKGGELMRPRSLELRPVKE
jgi:alpha-L-fucosidase